MYVFPPCSGCSGQLKLVKPSDELFSDDFEMSDSEISHESADGKTLLEVFTNSPQALREIIANSYLQNGFESDYKKLSRSYACPRFETPHRLQLKFNLMMVASNAQECQLRFGRDIRKEQDL